MKNPNAVELVRTMWSVGESKEHWTYDVVGFWDGELKHEDCVSFTKSGAIEFCKKNGYVICQRN